MSNCFYKADILLPKFKSDGEKMNKWAVIACDQYTSEGYYWEAVEKTVGECESTLRLTLPEYYLEHEECDRTSDINSTMEKYMSDGTLETFDGSMIYVERTLADGKVRRGLVGAIDLEEYDYNKGATSLVRATEGTVLSRIPPRVKIRRGAMIELPHIMMLIDDRENTVIEPLAEKKEDMSLAYDFELMQNGGGIKGYFVSDSEKTRINSALEALSDIDSYNAKYGVSEKSPMLFAVGDGNHSLASAKSLYEEIKGQIGEEAAKDHPARYALVEVVNIHDASLEFEPIYRVVFDTDVKKLLAELAIYAKTDKGGDNSFVINCTGKDIDENIEIKYARSNLAVGALQEFIDKYLAENDGKVDYIHGIDSTKALAQSDNAIGFIFDGMSKNDLFKSVIVDGSLPRKTFSMGHAYDKRYYLEARKVVK